MPDEYSGEKSTVREIELSESRTLGMADLIVTTKATRNKKLTDDFKETYRWNGDVYVIEKSGN